MEFHPYLDRQLAALAASGVALPRGPAWEAFLEELDRQVASGQELARRLQADQPRLKVIYTSGYSADLAGREFQLRAGESFLQKPFAPELLWETIRRSLDG